MTLGLQRLRSPRARTGTPRARGRRGSSCASGRHPRGRASSTCASRDRRASARRRGSRELDDPRARHARVLRLALGVRDPLAASPAAPTPRRRTRVHARVELDAVGRNRVVTGANIASAIEKRAEQERPAARGEALAPDRLHALRIGERLGRVALARLVRRARPSACRAAAPRSPSASRPLIARARARALRVGRPQPRRDQLGDVLADRERVPDHEVAVVEHRHASRRVDRRDLRLRVRLIEQDRLRLERDAALREREVRTQRP